MVKNMVKRKRTRRRKRGGEKGPTQNDHQKANNNAATSTATTVSASSFSFQRITKVVRAEALGDSLPPLVITYTNESSSIEKWLKQHVHDKKHRCLGIDTESKPSFTRKAALAARGSNPDTIQLAVADGHCLVIHLSRMENNDKSCLSLSQVLKNKDILKSGVGLDDDSLELHKNHSLDIACRLDLRTIHEKELEMERKRKRRNSENNDDQEQKPANQSPQGLKVLAEKYVHGLVLPKKKKLQLSNWAASLTNDQVGYAAADAFAGAAVVAALVAATDNDYTHQSLIKMTLDDELHISLVEKDRLEKKLARKRQKEKEHKERKAAGTNGKANQKDARKQVNNPKKRGKRKAPDHRNKQQQQRPQKASHEPTKKKIKLQQLPRNEGNSVAPVYRQISTALRSSR